MSTTTGYDPLLLWALDVAVVRPKAGDINKLLSGLLKKKKMAKSESEERANVVCSEDTKLLHKKALDRKNITLEP
jgi:hypothetical protein